MWARRTILQGTDLRQIALSVIGGQPVHQRHHLMGEFHDVLDVLRLLHDLRDGFDLARIKVSNIRPELKVVQSGNVPSEEPGDSPSKQPQP